MDDAKPLCGFLRGAEGAILTDIDGRRLHMKELCDSDIKFRM